MKHEDPSPEERTEIGPEESQRLLKEREVLAAQLVEYKDKYLRLMAEFENARKRMDREKTDFVKYANAELLSDFLAILDDLERSVEAAKAKHEDYTAFLKGIEMVMAHIYEMLKRNHVKPMEAVGKKFDPHSHEALLQVETDAAEEDIVLEELQKGYMYGDRVVRTAKVKVAKPKQTAAPDAASQEKPIETNPETEDK